MYVKSLNISQHILQNEPLVIIIIIMIIVGLGYLNVDLRNEFNANEASLHFSRYTY